MATKELSLERKINYKEGKPSPFDNRENELINFHWHLRETLFLASFYKGREAESVKDDFLYNEFLEKEHYLTRRINHNRILISGLTHKGEKELHLRIHTSLTLSEKIRVWARMNFNI